MRATERREEGFRDRHDAGRELAEHLKRYDRRPNTVVLGLPRGGIPVAYEAARRLHLPLDVFVVRKLGMPGHEELAMGAIASGGTVVLNPEVVAHLHRASEVVEAVRSEEALELDRRETLYRASRPRTPLFGKTVIVVDDGLATGATMRAAIAALRKQQVDRIVVAVPVGARETCELVREEADELVCPISSDYFMAVGQFYEDFSQTTDDEVADLLEQSAEKIGKP